jgi:molybdopterin-guanine dinucleotide biosynthesis protein A
MNLTAVILAGGESRRMGRDKAWVPFEGKPLLQLAVERLQALGVAEILISGRAGQDYSALKRPVLFDLEPGYGPMGGIERALHETASPLVLVLAVDLPHMSVDFLQKLAGSCDRLTGAVPRLNGSIEPLAAIYPKRCHAFAFAAIAKSQYAVRDFAAACLRERAVRIFPVHGTDKACFANWNCPSDVSPGKPAPI